MADDNLDPDTGHGEATEDRMTVREIINLILGTPGAEILVLLIVFVVAQIGCLVAGFSGFSLVESQRRQKRVGEITDQLRAQTSPNH
jgi:hypothetical protein